MTPKDLITGHVFHHLLVTEVAQSGLEQLLDGSTFRFVEIAPAEPSALEDLFGQVGPTEPLLLVIEVEQELIRLRFIECIEELLSSLRDVGNDGGRSFSRLLPER